MLKKYGQDLVEAARAHKLDPVIGRDTEIRNVIRILSRKTKNNPVLIGEPGVARPPSPRVWPSGSSPAMCPRGCARRRSSVWIWAHWSRAQNTAANSRSGSRPSSRKSRRARARSSSSSMSCTRLSVPDAPRAAWTRATCSKPLLARGELHCLGATTLNEYRQYIEKDAALERRFQPVLVNEPTVEDTISILRGLKERYEVYHGVKITDSALIAAATLSNRYISDRFLPDKAIDLVDEACATIRTEMDSMPHRDGRCPPPDPAA